jgi:hypothetical protein
VRLALLVFAIALATSRLGLLLHEVIGHGLVAIGLGGDITGWSLHTFGGGWVGFARAEPWTGAAALAVTLGGIAVEGVAAVLLTVGARRTRGAARLALGGAAWALAIHAAFYLAAGTFHGFGDGALLRHRLGDARWLVVAPAAAAAIALGYLAAKNVLPRLRQLVPAATPNRQLGAIALALAAAGAAHATLTIAELKLRKDPKYGVVMQSEKDRTVARELAQRIAAAEASGQQLQPDQIRAARRELERRHRDVPFAPALGIAIAAAVILGALRSPPAGDARAPSTRTLAVSAAIATASVLLVVLLDHLPP